MRLLSHIRKRFGSIDKHSFYEGKALEKVEWWLSYCSEYPDLAWARLRLFSDGSADAAFEESKVYGFDSREYAVYFLSEDEYILSTRWTSETRRTLAQRRQIFRPRPSTMMPAQSSNISAHISERRDLTTACTRPATRRLSTSC